MTSKTIPAGLSVPAYLDAIFDPQREADCRRLAALMEDVSGETPILWGAKLPSAIVGFGTYHYRYDSGREGDHLRIGFANRKAAITIYIMPGYEDFSTYLEKLGPHKTGKSCLYIKRLSDIDLDVLRDMLVEGLRLMDEKYPR